MVGAEKNRVSPSIFYSDTAARGRFGWIKSIQCVHEVKCRKMTQQLVGGRLFEMKRCREDRRITLAPPQC